MTKPRILAFSGSARVDSYNQKLVKVASQGSAAAGADVTLINLRDYPLPIFDEDLERNEGTPENAVRLKNLFLENDGLLISCPEYNSSITPLLKNVIDWVSRGVEGEPPAAAYRGKVASLMAASPGGLGGLRGLVHVRAILGNLGVVVLPKQVAVSRAFEAFNDDGSLADEKQHAAIKGLGQSLADTIAKLQS